MYLIKRQQMQIKSTIAENRPREKRNNLIVHDKWTKRGGQFAKVLQRKRGNEKEG